MKIKAEAITRTNSTLTLSELQIVVVSTMLKRGYVSTMGGDKLAEWLETNRGQIMGVFGADDRVYVCFKDSSTAKAFLGFLMKNGIGDEKQWINPKGSNQWWLQIWWD